jgi:ribose 5-phosphate isomerase RpiB
MNLKITSVLSMLRRYCLITGLKCTMKSRKYTYILKYMAQTLLQNCRYVPYGVLVCPVGPMSKISVAGQVGVTVCKQRGTV